MDPGGSESAEVWAFDLDGTLIGSVRSDVLRPHAVTLLHELARREVTCVLWSAGGSAYARRHAIAHGIETSFAAFYGKVERDDHRRYVTDHFAPAHLPLIFVDDAPQDIPLGATVIAVPQFIGGNPADSALVPLIDGLRARS